MHTSEEAEFQDALDSLLGAEPPRARTQRALAQLEASVDRWDQAIWYGVLTESPVGPLLVAVGRDGLVAIEFGQDEAGFVDRLSNRTGSPVWKSQQHVAEAVGQLNQYMNGKRRGFELAVDLSGLTTFQRQVLKAALKVPAGVVATYGEIARHIGKPRAARAVGQALARNPIPIVVPCHRVVAADGTLTGYSGGAGVETKRRLLHLEGAMLA